MMIDGPLEVQLRAGQPKKPIRVPLILIDELSKEASQERQLLSLRGNPI